MRIDSAIMLGHIWEIKMGSEPESQEFYILFDYPKYSSHIIMNNDTSLIANKEFEKLEWTKEEKNTPGGKILEYFCSQNKEYTMLNIWGEKVDISNYIISGLYSPKERLSNHIFEIINNNPYVPTQDDEQIIHAGISNWLVEKYPNSKFSLEKNLYRKVKYSFSQMGVFNMINDVYMIDILPNEEIGKLTLRFDFARFSVPSEHLKKNEIRIYNE